MAMDETNGGGKKKPKPGILRLDIKKPRSSSRGSVEFCNETDILGEVTHFFCSLCRKFLICV